MSGSQTYLVRYGLMGRLGRVRAGAESLARGEAVVVRSPRGEELGEVLAPLSTAGESDPALGLRRAGPDDLARARSAEGRRADCFEACSRVFRDGLWPIELIDAEPLLDDARVILHYLGPHGLDVDGLREALRRSLGLDVLFAPAGPDEAGEPPSTAGCGDGCGSCGCHDGHALDEGHGLGGCDGCAIKPLLAARRAVAART